MVAWYCECNPWQWWWFKWQILCYVLKSCRKDICGWNVGNAFEKGEMTQGKHYDGESQALSPQRHCSALSIISTCRNEDPGTLWDVKNWKTFWAELGEKLRFQPWIKKFISKCMPLSFLIAQFWCLYKLCFSFEGSDMNCLFSTMHENPRQQNINNSFIITVQLCYIEQQLQYMH